MTDELIENAAAQLEERQKTCLHDKPLIPSLTGHSVCMICWKKWPAEEFSETSGPLLVVPGPQA